MLVSLDELDFLVVWTPGGLVLVNAVADVFVDPLYGDPRPPHAGAHAPVGNPSPDSDRVIPWRGDVRHLSRRLVGNDVLDNTCNLTHRLSILLMAAAANSRRRDTHFIARTLHL